MYKEIPKFNGWETTVSFFPTLSGVSAQGWQPALLRAGVSGTRWRVAVLQWSTGDFQNLLARRGEEQKSGARGFHLSKWYRIRQIIFALVCWWSCGSNHITYTKGMGTAGSSIPAWQLFSQLQLLHGRKEELDSLSWCTASSLCNVFSFQQFAMFLLQTQTLENTLRKTCFLFFFFRHWFPFLNSFRDTTQVKGIISHLSYSDLWGVLSLFLSSWHLLVL